jgi:hypothetical protein
VTIAIIELRTGASHAALQGALVRAGVASGSLDDIDTVAIAPFRPGGTGPDRDLLDRIIVEYALPISLDHVAGAVVADQALIELMESIAPLHRSDIGAARVTGSAASVDSAGSELIRVLIGEDGTSGGLIQDRLVVLETNIDDMSPQFYELLSENLFAAGALDVWTSAIAMKKGRSAVSLHVLANAERQDVLIGIIIEQSTTLGVRSHAVDRYSVPRRFESVETRWGTVQLKLKIWNGRVIDIAPEYDDCSAIARANDVPVRSVWAEAYNIGQVFIGRRSTGAGQPTLQLIDPLGAPPESD